MTPTLPEIARAVRGRIAGRQVLAPGPGHSRKDLSLAIWLSGASPDGFTVHSHAGDPWQECRDYVADALGLDRDRWRERQEADPISNMQRRVAQRAAEEAERADIMRRQRLASAIWDAAQDPRGTLVEEYLQSRALDLPHDIAGHALRFEPRGRWEGGTAPMLIAAMRCVHTRELKAVHRTALTDDGRKIGRKMLDPAAGTAIMLAPATERLVIGEGIESCLSAIQLGYGSGVWAMGSAGAIGRLPILDHVEHLVLLEERDTASANAVSDCGHRWSRASKVVSVVLPTTGKDLNDSLRGIV